MCSSRMLVNFCWTEWSIRLLYRLEVRSGDAGCYRLFYGCCWLMLEHVQEEGPSSASSTGMEFVGEKKKRKKTTTEGTHLKTDDDDLLCVRKPVSWCAVASPAA